MTRKWNIVNDNSNANYDAGNKISYNTKVLKSNLCDQILVKRIIVTAAPQTQTPFKNCTHFTKCSSNYSETTESLWFYSRDEATSFNNDIANDGNFESSKYKAKLLENIEADIANGILKKCINCCSIKIFK